MSLTLTQAELKELTGKERPTAQARQLRVWAVPFKLRSDGSLAVLRVHVTYETEEKEPPSPTVRSPKARRVLPRKEQQVEPVGA